jgi:hypothetical protein
MRTHLKSRRWEFLGYGLLAGFLLGVIVARIFG